MTVGENQRMTYLSLQSTQQWQGAATHVREVIAGLRRRGWTVDVHEPRYSSANPSTLARIWQFAVLQLRAAVGSRGADVLYVRHHPVAAAASLWWRGPRVEEVNGTLEDFFVAHPWSRRLRHPMEAASRHALRTADAVIVPNTGLVQWIRGFAGVDRVEVIPNGVNPQLFHPARAAETPVTGQYVAFVGALVEWEGVDDLLAAIDQPSWPGSVRLVVAGDGVQRPLVEAMAARSPLVEYLGPIAYEKVGAILAGSVASMSPNTRSRWGASPLKLYEAMASGVPIIASDTAGQAEIVREAGCGVVVPVGDPAAIAEAVAALAADGGRTQVLGEAGHTSSSEHSWDRRAEALGTVLAGIMKRSQPARR